MMKILWIDDEIDLLKPYIIFLQEKKYEVLTADSGHDAFEILDSEDVDVVFLDENMPGLSGLEVLTIIKDKKPTLPVIMITKSEQEHIMEQAIGSKISDYLIKPVNPNQILLTLKKNLQQKELVSTTSTQNYQQEFRQISLRLMEKLDYEDWKEIYRKLIFWELELENSNDESIYEILKQQKEEANNLFCRFFENNYQQWLTADKAQKPVQSHTLIKEKVLPILDNGLPTFLFVLDNFRFDHWKAIQSEIEDMFYTEEEDMFYAIVPTTTQYARNAIFSGLMPSEIEKKYPQFWINENEEGAKNDAEQVLLVENLKRYGRNLKTSYHKVLNVNFGRRMLDSLDTMMGNDLNVIIYNFIDMLSHARTENELVKELAEDEKGYRSITRTWFANGVLKDALKYLSQKKVNVIITTDHGSVWVDKPIRIKGDKSMSNNPRYKQGLLMDYNSKEVFEVKDGSNIFLPKMNINNYWIFCRTNTFFAYPNNYNEFVKFFKNTFQHGGISMEEVLVPFISLRPKI